MPINEEWENRRLLDQMKSLSAITLDGFRGQREALDEVKDRITKIEGTLVEQGKYIAAQQAVDERLEPMEERRLVALEKQVATHSKAIAIMTAEIRGTKRWLKWVTAIASTVPGGQALGWLTSLFKH